MNEVKVSTSELLKVLEKNRQAHKEVYDRTLEGYHKKVIEVLREALAKAEAGEKYETNNHIPEPVHHLADYDTVISMLGMSVEDQVTLTREQYTNFVMDNWAWSNSFTALSGMYYVDTN